MNIKRIGIGSLVGLVVLYAVGYVFWVMLFGDFFAEQSGTATGVDRETPILWAMIVGTLLYAVLLTLALESHGGSTSVMDGVKVGAVIGLLLWGTTDFIIFGLTNLNTLTGAIADIVLEGLRAAIAGAVVAFVLSKVESGDAAPAAHAGT